MVKWGHDWVSVPQLARRIELGTLSHITLISDKSASKRLALFKTKKRGAERYYVG